MRQRNNELCSKCEYERDIAIPSIGSQRKCEEVCTYVIVGDSNAGLLLVSSALSMSHLARWNCPCLLIALAWGSSKQATCSPVERGLLSTTLHQTRRHYASLCLQHLCVANRIAGNARTVSTYFGNNLRCCRTSHDSDSMIMKRGADAM